MPLRYSAASACPSILGAPQNVHPRDSHRLQSGPEPRLLGGQLSTCLRLVPRAAASAGGEVAGCGGKSLNPALSLRFSICNGRKVPSLEEAAVEGTRRSGSPAGGAPGP